MKRKYKIPETLMVGDQQREGRRGCRPAAPLPRRRGVSASLRSLLRGARPVAHGPQHGLSEGAALGRGRLKTALSSFLKKSSGL